MKNAAVLGSPIQHSLSPLIHAAAYRKLGFEASYVACEVTSDGLRDFLASKLSQSEWIGFSLTMPLKEKVCEIAADLGIVANPQALQISSANTLYREGDQWRATSTDVTGFSFLLGSQEFEGATIFGAGGTARAAIEALDPQIPITIVSRSEKRESEIRIAFPHRNFRFVSWSGAARAWNNQLVVVAVPISAIAELATTFTAPEFLVDVLYSPWIPPLTRMQMEAGKSAVTGIDLLCAQALGQIRLMTGSTFDDHELFEYLKRIAENHLSHN